MYSGDYAVGALDTFEELLKERDTLKKQLSSLQAEYAKRRFRTYTERKNFLARIRKLEQQLHLVLRDLTAFTARPNANLHTKTKPKVKSGINVTVELSLDGVIFSNPAPTVPNGARLWVRAKIETAHTGEIGVPQTPEMCHISWAHTAKGYIKQDYIPISGHDEYFVSFPLVITREFLAPASLPTRSNWLVYVDVYERVNPTRYDR